MFTIAHDLTGGPNALAEAFYRFVPSTQIKRIASPDKFRWSGRLSGSNGRMLWSVRSNADWEFTSSANDVGIVVLSLPESGALRMSQGNKDDVAAPGQAIIQHLPAIRSSCAYSVEGHARTTLKWNRTEVERAIGSEFENIKIAALDAVPILDLSRGRGPVILALLNAISIDLANPQISSPLASDLMHEAVLRLLFEPVVSRWRDRHGRDAIRIMPRHVKQAVDFMHANAGAPIRIRDIADACCVTPRTLENGFKVFKDTTPLAYLRQLRLKGARRDLESADIPRIAEIARRWGFADLGRFAERYRREFDELPSDTVRRR
jgi:AraC-like DNA-binding protein